MLVYAFITIINVALVILYFVFLNVLQTVDDNFNSG